MSEYANMFEKEDLGELLEEYAASGGEYSHVGYDFFNESYLCHGNDTGLPNALVLDLRDYFVRIDARRDWPQLWSELEEAHNKVLEHYTHENMTAYDAIWEKCVAAATYGLNFKRAIHKVNGKPNDGLIDQLEGIQPLAIGEVRELASEYADADGCVYELDRDSYLLFSADPENELPTFVTWTENKGAYSPCFSKRWDTKDELPFKIQEIIDGYKNGRIHLDPIDTVEWENGWPVTLHLMELDEVAQQFDSTNQISNSKTRPEMEKRSLRFGDVLDRLLPYVEERAKQFGVWLDTGSAKVKTHYTFTGAELLQEEANRQEFYWNDGEIVPDTLYAKHEYSFHGTGTPAAVYAMSVAINTITVYGNPYDSSMDYCWANVGAEADPPVHVVDEEEEATGIIDISIMFLALMED